MSESNTISKMKSMFGPSALNNAVKENGGTISPIISNANDTTVVVEAPKKKRGRPPKKKTDESTTTTQTVVDVPFCETSEPYNHTYDETNYLLRESIGQINNLTGVVQHEIENIQKSKTLKGKYKYISELCSTAGTLASTKVAVIREMNSTITNCHKLEMQREKDIKNSAAAIAANQNDDKYMADLYNAYINTPVNTPNPLLAHHAGNTINNSAIMMSGTNLMGDSSEDQNYQEYLKNLTPEQNRMLLENNPNIETVVVYDPSTGSKSFDVIDITTGIPVANYPRPDSIMLEDTVIDFSTGIATNNNIGKNWKVVTCGDPINKY